MSSVGQCEVHTQQRAIVFMRDAFGYDCLGHWNDRDRNIEAEQLTDWLRRQGHGSRLIDRALSSDASRALVGPASESVRG